MHVYDVGAATTGLPVVLLLQESTSERYLEAETCRFRAANTFQNAVATMVIESEVRALKPPLPTLRQSRPLWRGPMTIQGAHHTAHLSNFELIPVKGLPPPSLSSEQSLQASEMKILAIHHSIPWYGTITNAYVAFEVRLCAGADTATGLFVDSWISSRLSVLVKLGEWKMWCYWREDSVANNLTFTCRALLVPPVGGRLRTALAESYRIQGGIAEISRAVAELPVVTVSKLLMGEGTRAVTCDELDDGRETSRKRQRITEGPPDMKAAIFGFVNDLHVPTFEEGVVPNMGDEIGTRSRHDELKEENCDRRARLRLKLRLRPKELTVTKVRKDGLDTELPQNQYSNSRQVCSNPQGTQRPCKQDLDKQADKRRTGPSTAEGEGDVPKWSGSEQRKRPRVSHSGGTQKRQLEDSGKAIEDPSFKGEVERLNRANQDCQRGNRDQRQRGDIIVIHSSSEENTAGRKERTQTGGPLLGSFTHSFSRQAVSIRSNCESFQTGATRSQRTKAAMEEDRALRNRLIRARYERLSRRPVDPSLSCSKRRTYPNRPQHQPKLGHLASRYSLLRTSSNNVAYAATTSVEVLDSLSSMRPFFKYGQSDRPVFKGSPSTREWRCIGEEVSGMSIENAQGEYEYPHSAPHGVEFAEDMDERDGKLAAYEKLMARSGQEFASMGRWDLQTASRVERAVGKLRRLGAQSRAGGSAHDHVGDASRYRRAIGDRPEGVVATTAPVESQRRSSGLTKRRSAGNIEFPRFVERRERSIGLDVDPRRPRDRQRNDRCSVIGRSLVGHASRRQGNMMAKRRRQPRDELPLNETLERAVQPKNSGDDCMRTFAAAGLSGCCGTGTAGDCETSGIKIDRHRLVSNVLLALQNGELRDADRRLLLQNLK